MPEIGQNLSHYSIMEKIGRGGMGEVYRAKDSKLGRDVAIKVLPEEFARDADRVARFQREAKLLASLNHPNIAAIYGLEESGKTNFLVLELVEGTTLADRIKAGAIPVEESLKLALQIAEALEAAHEKGVIHRDLKPSNIKVTPEGKVKVLDFGLAKAYAGDREQMNLSNSPTLSDMATQQGVILGTAAYMSPEQARGKSVDKRTDIWAFGCVFYEMLTGQSAFQGEDVTEILAAVVKGGANLDLLPANIHPRVREVIIRCLLKDVNRRYHDIADAKYEIERALADPSGVFMQPLAAMGSQTKMQTIMPWIAAALALGAIIAGVAVWKLKPPEPHQITRLSYEIPEGQQFGDPLECALAVSPDGRKLVYGTNEGLYLRSMDELNARLIPGTAGIRQRPFFSPDGKWIGFFSSADNTLKKIAIGGGAPVTLAEINPLGSFCWGSGDRILYVQPFRGIMLVSANGGTPEQIIKAAENEVLMSPQFLADGKSVLFVNGGKVMVHSLISGKRKQLLPGFTPRYVPTGHLVYAVGNSLFAVPFDPGRLQISGTPLPIIEGVRQRNEAQYAISDSGTLFYMPVEASGTSYARAIVWVGRNGKEEPILLQPKLYSSPRISPDGKQVALGIAVERNRDIWILDLLRETITPITDDSGVDDFPLWTHDGKRIAFHTDRNGGSIYWKASDGTGKDEPLATAPGREIIPFSWSRDGKSLVSMEINLVPLQTDIGLISMEGNHARKLLLQTKYYESHPQVSPDGRWLAYASNESGRYEVYVRPFPEVERGRSQVSTNGGDNPLWSPDGRELFYRSGDSCMSAGMKTEPMLSIEKPKLLFRGTYVSSNLGFGEFEPHPWDISPDGKRFLMMKPLGAASGRAKINIVLNWFEELKQRVPTK